MHERADRERTRLWGRRVPDKNDNILASGTQYNADLALRVVNTIFEAI
jgi:hypothetical protein